MTNPHAQTPIRCLDRLVIIHHQLHMLVGPITPVAQQNVAGLGLAWRNPHTPVRHIIGRARQLNTGLPVGIPHQPRAIEPDLARIDPDPRARPAHRTATPRIRNAQLRQRGLHDPVTALPTVEAASDALTKAQALHRAAARRNPLPGTAE